MNAGDQVDLSGKLSAKDKYRRLCQEEATIPIFSLDWWLDAVCGSEGWNVAVLERGGQCIAAMPYALKRRYRLRALTNPPLTQTLGPWIRYPAAQKLATKYPYEKDVIHELLDQLPPHDYFRQNFHHGITNWLPFYWKGFEQTTLYTYVLDELQDLDTVWAGLRDNVRRDVRKAQRELTVSSDGDINGFLDIHQMSYARQNLSMPYSRDLVVRLDEACAARNARRIFFARDAGGRIHAVLYLVWYGGTAYDLLAGVDPSLKGSGAGSLLLWEAIRFASTVASRFDFEGSMVESIGRFLGAFGGRQVAYFRVSRMSPGMRGLHLARELFKTLVGRTGA